MTKGDLKGFFESFIEKESLFSNKKALQTSYMPNKILHRDSEFEKVANILAPCLKGDRPSNLFIYGKTGTGKTLTIKNVVSQLEEVSKKTDKPLRIIYINCKLKKIADTEYRLIAQLGRELGKEIPSTGLPTDEVYNLFYSSVDQQNQLLIIILDEIDQLIKKTGDGILYNLTRINENLKNSQLTLIGISNDLCFTDNLDPRAKSSLSEESLVFPPYNALQLQDILKQRSNEAFRENVLAEGVIEKCSAFAAREHGDARRALELLRVAGELAERIDAEKVSIKHIDQAQSKIEDDWIIELVRTQPKQFQAVLYSITLLFTQKQEMLFTGEVYTLYKKISEKISLAPLTQRRISDIIAELDMLGIINAKVLSKGRYGRTREIQLSIPRTTTLKVKDILCEGLGISQQQV